LSFRPDLFLCFVWHQLGGMVAAFRVVRRWKPDLVFAFGGFSSAAVCTAGFYHNLPVVLHEANRVPGRAVRALAPLADRVYLPVGARLGPGRARKVRNVGFPVRREIHRMSKTKAREALGLDPNRKVLVIFGGSQGAKALNDWVDQRLEGFAKEGVQVYCVTGLGKGVGGKFEIKARDGSAVRSIFTPFSDQIAEVLSAADLVISRAGAGTIAELIRCRAPAILVPYPHSADNHQWANARFFEMQGGGLAVGQDYLGELHKEVSDLVFNDWLLGKFRANLERMDRENSLEQILIDLDNLVTEGKVRRQMDAAPA
jgi:UDP-N-acetylglucosamine--N-acetylmuramyl-(pentapeptide) pyrophosphoryl-undecaprenol N-acetylglucosamine transferase